jgi:isoleucyl-tRNA synthetase
MYSEGIENLEANANSENILDKWILIRLQEVVNKSVDGYENYKLDEAVSGVDKFIDDFSTWYLRRSRDRLKADMSNESENSKEEKQDKLQALNTMKYIFVEFSKTIAPVMPFLAERLYKEVQNQNTLLTSESVHLEKYPEKKEINEENKKVLEDMSQARNVVTEILMMRQKQNVPVRQPLSSLTLNKSINIKVATIIMEELNIKDLKYDTSLENSILDFTLTPELIREGKQRELSREIKDMRKELGLVSLDSIILFIDGERFELLDEAYKKEMKIRKVKEAIILTIDKY